MTLFLGQKGKMLWLIAIVLILIGLLLFRCKSVPIAGFPCSDDRSTIFVSIASYRDPECEATVRRLLETACYPDRLTIVVLEQLEPGDASLQGKLPIQVLSLAADQARGPLYARTLIQREMRDQRYYLQLDSHMWPRQGWDCELIRQIEQCPRPEKTFLTNYPNNYDRRCPSGEKDPSPTRLVAKQFNADGVLEIKGVPAGKQDKPFPSKFASAGFLFGPAPPIWDLADTEDLFFGEEIFNTVRLFTFGYDLYSPSEQIMFHLWDRSYRPTFWEHQTADRKINGQVKWAKLEAILQGNDPSLLGTERSLEDYKAYSGVDFKRKTF